MMEPGRIRQLLESLGVVLGVVLSVIAIWNSFRPSSQLVGEVNSVRAVIAPQTAAALEAIPERLLNSLDRDQRPDAEALRSALNPAAREALRARLVEFIKLAATDPLVEPGAVAVVHVSNRGEQALKGVWLSLARSVDRKRPVRLYLPGQVAHVVEVEGRIDFGELRPGEEASAEVWDTFDPFLFSPTLSHDGGVGELDYPVFVPGAYPRGYWISQGQALVGSLVAGALAIIVAVGAWRHRSVGQKGLAPTQGS